MCLKSFGHKTEVGLFFGSFNPIHNGHLNLAHHILDHTYIEQVWFVVSPNNPLKNADTLMDENIRVKLAQAAIDSEERMRVCDIELSMPRPSYTANTLRELSLRHPNLRFTLIIGADNMLCFNRWREYNFILSNYPIMVYPRPNYPLNQITALYPQMQVLQDAPLFDISATQIRQLLHSNPQASLNHLMPDNEAALLKQIWNTNN